MSHWIAPPGRASLPRSGRARLAPLALLLAAATLAAGCATQPISHDSRVVVLDFDANLEQPADQSLPSGLADLLSGKLADAAGVQVKERRAVGPYLANAQNAPINWQRLGRRLGVDYIVVGSVAQLARDYVINTRLFDVSSGMIIKGSSLFRACERKEDLYPTLTAMTRGIAFHLNYLAQLRAAHAAQAGSAPAVEPAVTAPSTTSTGAPNIP